MPRVPVSADTGMKRLSSFGIVSQPGQGSVENRANSSETFRMCEMPGECFLPFEAEGQNFRVTRNNSSCFTATRPRLASLETPYCQPGYAPDQCQTNFSGVWKQNAAQRSDHQCKYYVGRVELPLLYLEVYVT